MAAPTRTPFIGGNFKCNGTIASLTTLIDTFNKASVPARSSAEVVVCPPTLYVNLVQSQLRKEWSVGVQNVYLQNGAFTGEISPEMVKDLGVEWIILGHSERRHVFKETDELIGQKTAKAQALGLKIIGCVGELIEERDAGKTFEVVERQLSSFAKNVANWDNFVIAYEPVWAIGAGRTATPPQAQEVHASIRKWLVEHVSQQVSDKTRILYGGSVKGANSSELFAQHDVDGFLVGGASLQPDFITIVNSSNTPKLGQ